MLLSLSLFALPSFAQEVSIRDSLSSGTTASTVYGGTFTGAGWRVDDPNSRLYWDFGTQVERGTVSFTTDDITLANLTDDNNEFIQLFDTGDKWSCTRAVTVRVYGDLNPESWGDIKLKTWDNAAGLWSEARGGVQNWDGEPHTWTVTWDSSTATLARDGVQIVALDVTGQDLRVGTMWLPLNTWDYGYLHPIGSIYSNLAFDGWEPGEEDDPPDVPPVDGGRPPIEDVGAYSGGGDSVYGADYDLPLEGSSELSYLMFDLSDISGTITSATLNVHTQSDSHADGDGGVLYQVSDTTWSENTLTWNNRPPLGAVVSSFGAVGPDQTLSFDVTAFVAAGGRTAFAIANGGSNGAHFWSKEGNSSPSLVFTAVADDGGSGDDDGGADDGSDDDGTGNDADTGLAPSDENSSGEEDEFAAGGIPGMATPMDGGACACGSSATSGLGFAGLAGAMAVGRRIRRRVG